MPRHRNAPGDYLFHTYDMFRVREGQRVAMRTAIEGANASTIQSGSVEETHELLAFVVRGRFEILLAPGGRSMPTTAATETETDNEHDHNERRHRDLLQGLGQAASGQFDRNANPADGVGSLTNGPRTHPAHAEGAWCIRVSIRDWQNGNPG